MLTTGESSKELRTIDRDMQKRAKRINERRQEYRELRSAATTTHSDNTTATNMREEKLCLLIEKLFLDLDRDEAELTRKNGIIKLINKQVSVQSLVPTTTTTATTATTTTVTAPEHNTNH